VTSILRVDEAEIPWSDYEPGEIRVKMISGHDGPAPPMQYVEYAPGHSDNVHSHGEGEVFVVMAGEVILGDTVNGPGTIVYIPSGVEYAMRGGDIGARFLRIVVP
jgi:quercetin dioxygenase-like cupin family protein